MKRIYCYCLLLAIAFGISAMAQTPREVFKLPAEKQHYVSPTRYSYRLVAERLTEGCKTDLERIEAIYNWVTRNIAYDTSYSIRTADACFDAKKGVCQGYCELFYRIAEAAGLRVEIVSGISRDIYGVVSDAGHAWLFAYTRESYGILLDPTWDAGSVNNGEFTRGTYHRGWFGVDPKWMILTHFPGDPSYQLIPRQMSEEEFRSLDYPLSLHYVYGFDAGEMYSQARERTLSVPKVYSGAAGDFVFLEAPLQARLEMGKTYTFRVRMKTDKEFILADGRFHSILSGDWENEGNGIYSINYTPSSPGKVYLGIREKNAGGSVSTAVVYLVEPEGGNLTEDGKQIVTFRNSISSVLSGQDE